MRRLAQKKKCLQHRALIVAWLRVNYGLQASGSIAKRDVFVHYNELCRANKIQPSSAASFGKILKMAFPTVKCNRVGPRGASKHHYRGLVLRDQYHLSLENVQPISDAAIAEMMKNMEEGDDHGDDDDDEDESPPFKSEEASSAYTSPTQQHAQQHSQQPHQQQQHYHSSSSSPSSPHIARGNNHSPPQPNANGYYAQFMPPPPPAYSAYSLPPPTGKPAFVLPPPPQQQLHYLQHAAGGGIDLKKESFSWISPDMDGPTSRAIAQQLQQQQQQQQQQLQQPPSANPLALREWTEKRDLVEFCERNFQSLYDSILRTQAGGDSKDQVLTYVAEAWKSLRQYTRHMNLFPEQQPHEQEQGQRQQTVASPSSGKQTADEQQDDRGRCDQDERYNQLGSDHEELKRRGVLDNYNMPPQQQVFHQPLSVYQHHQQQQQQHKRPFDSTPPPHADLYGAPASQNALHYMTGASTNTPLSLSGGASSLSLSWLNSMALSVNSAQQQQLLLHHQNQNQHRASALPSPNGPVGSSYHLPSFASAEMGNRGSLDGLEYRSFEWKGVFE